MSDIEYPPFGVIGFDEVSEHLRKIVDPDNPDEGFALIRFEISKEYCVIQNACSQDISLVVAALRLCADQMEQKERGEPMETEH